MDDNILERQFGRMVLGNSSSMQDSSFALIANAQTHKGVFASAGFLLNE